MASPRDLYDAGAPAWRMPSAGGAADQVLTAGVAGVSIWAAAGAGTPHAVAVASTAATVTIYSSAAAGVAGVVTGGPSPLAAYSAVSTTAIVAPPGNLVETSYLLPGYTFNIPASNVLNAAINRIGYAAQPTGAAIPALAETMRVRVTVTLNGVASDVYATLAVLNPGPVLGAGTSALVWTLPAPVNFNAAGVHSIRTYPVTFTTTTFP